MISALTVFKLSWLLFIKKKSFLNYEYKISSAAVLQLRKIIETAYIDRFLLCVGTPSTQFYLHGLARRHICDKFLFTQCIPWADGFFFIVMEIRVKRRIAKHMRSTYWCKFEKTFRTTWALFSFYGLPSTRSFWKKIVGLGNGDLTYK